jgi:Tol biopolymer transport system component
MRRRFHRTSNVAAPAILILLVTSCDSAPFEPGGPGIFPGGPQLHPDSVAEPGSRSVNSRMAFGLCLEWEWDASFNDVCGVGGIVIRDQDGSEAVVLAEEDFYADDPAWSPDGSKIAFTGFPHCIWFDVEPCTRDIYVMNEDGSSLTRLTNSSGAGNSEPAWTPDGLRIAYVALTHEGTVFRHRLHVVNADGSGAAPLADLVGSNPAWSPDGTRLLFATQDGGGWKIHVADADGSNAVPLTHEPEANDYRPSWSPDGGRIAFTRSRTHADGSGSCQVFVMNADGSNLSQLTQDLFCAHNPAWSPDGTAVAYTGAEFPDHGIMVINPDGSGAALLRPATSSPSRVAWAPVP